MAANTGSNARALPTGSVMTEPLDSERIAESVNPALRPILRRVTVLSEVDSTNSELARLPLPEQHAHAVLAEEQLIGRGRRQRSWHSPPGGNIYLSLGWRFHSENLALSNLPLVTALCVAGALARAGLEGHGIKWPNDILVSGKKLAGILVELQSTGSEPANAVIGVGINVRMPRNGQDPEQVIDRPWTDLESHLSAASNPVDRNRLASMLLDRLIAGLQRFEDSGFASFQAAWNGYDLLQGREIRLEHRGREVAGTACGIDADGGLLLEVPGHGVRVFHSGEVSVIQ